MSKESPFIVDDCQMMSYKKPRHKHTIFEYLYDLIGPAQDV